MSFVDKLRMNNIFPANGYNPFGPPDMNQGVNLDEISMLMNRAEPYIVRQQQAQRDHEIKMLGMQQQGQLSNIGQRMQTPPVQTNKPMDVIYQPNDPLAMKKRELDLKERDLTQKGELGRGNLDIKQQIANLRIPESEKLALLQKYGLEKISATTEGRNETENLRQTGRETLLDTRGNQNKIIQNVRGNQQLANIAVQVAGRNAVTDKNILARTDAAKLKADAKENEPMAPNLVRVAENNAARQLANTRPDLAQFIVPNEMGSYDIKPSGDPVIDDTIRAALYGKKDVKLSSNTKKSDTKKVEVKPSKYKVTVK